LKKASILDIIAARRSYRGKYKPMTVPREDLSAIMQAGLAAPSGCNKQTTSLIAVDDRETLEKLWAVIHPPVAETAPAMICVLTRRIIAYRDRCFAVQDYAAAIENMLLAAVALGYQSCWYEGHITDKDQIGRKMAKLLGVPDEYELVCMLPIGVAQGEAAAPPKRPFEERAWFNRFPEEKAKAELSRTEKTAKGADY
jgi:nitroreductase